MWQILRKIITKFGTKRLSKKKTNFKHNQSIVFCSCSHKTLANHIHTFYRHEGPSSMLTSQEWIASKNNQMVSVTSIWLHNRKTVFFIGITIAPESQCRRWQPSPGVPLPSDFEEITAASSFCAPFCRNNSTMFTIHCSGHSAVKCRWMKTIDGMVAIDAFSCVQASHLWSTETWTAARWVHIAAVRLQDFRAWRPGGVNQWHCFFSPDSNLSDFCIAFLLCV